MKMQGILTCYYCSWFGAMSATQGLISRRVADAVAGRK
jgi:hypothetical protein